MICRNEEFLSLQLFIGGLPSLVDRQTLWNYFSQFGQLEESVVMMDKLTGRSRGFGFITFVNVKDLEVSKTFVWVIGIAVVFSRVYRTPTRTYYWTRRLM